MRAEEIRLEAARLVFSRLDTLQVIDKSPNGIIKIIDEFAKFISKGKKTS
jgi:hypothetical protein